MARIAANADEQVSSEATDLSRMETAGGSNTKRQRKPPRPFRSMTVARVEQLSSRMLRLTFVGAELRGLYVDGPASSVRLLIPSSDNGDLVIPKWNGNEFLLPDGSRPIIRTFTPRYMDPVEPFLVLDIVLHDRGAVANWARTALSGYPAAVSGPGRSYAIDRRATDYVLLGDESAIPAISQLLEAIPGWIPVRATIEVAHPEAQVMLPHHPAAVVEWLDQKPGSAPGDNLVRVAETAHLAEGVRLWAAGEAAAMHRIRRNLFAERGLSRSAATVRGYWKNARLRRPV